MNIFNYTFKCEFGYFGKKLNSQTYHKPSNLGGIVNSNTFWSDLCEKQNGYLVSLRRGKKDIQYPVNEEGIMEQNIYFPASMYALTC
jgi:hypothetical protein